MRLPYGWLKEFVKIKQKPEELAQNLTMAGFEVEEIINGHQKFVGGPEKVLSLEITPNRPDVLSIIGAAREISSLTGQKLNFKIPKFKTENLEIPLDVQFKNKSICPRYTYRIITGVNLKNSPGWMKKKLTDVDIRPINNIVDVTNYVMLEAGQPLHAFDYDKISGHKMIIRGSKKGESLKTLDDQNRKLPKEVVVISDAKKIIDLAGIMGGENSQISNNTKTIVLQAAIFEPLAIRKTSKNLNLTTEASYRYERGVDFEATNQALDRATELILYLAAGRAGKIFDIINLPPKPISIPVSSQKISALLGTKISKTKISQILTSLGFEIKRNSATPPSWRSDIKIWQDLAEEIARISGLNNLKTKALEPFKVMTKNQRFATEQIIKDILSDFGFIEALSYSYLSADNLQAVGVSPKETIEIQNPISPETQYLRPSIAPTLLKLISRNPWAPEIKIFETGSVFAPKEKRELVIAFSGKNLDIASEIIKKLKDHFGLEDLEYNMAPVTPEVLQKFKIKRKLNLIIINLDELVKNIKIVPEECEITQKQIKFVPVSKFPPSVFDLAFIVEFEKDTSEIASEIQKIDKHILFVELFDEFASEKFGKGKKNVAFHIWLQGWTHTLKDKEIEDIRQKIIGRLKSKFSAKLRTF